MLNLNIKKEELGYLRLLIDLAALDNKVSNSENKSINGYRPVKAVS